MNFEKMFYEIFNHDIIEIFRDFAFTDINVENGNKYENANIIVYNYSFKYNDEIIYADIMINFEKNIICYILSKNDKNNIIYRSYDKNFNNYQDYNDFLFDFYDRINDNIFKNY